jgi:hypothetical protein
MNAPRSSEVEVIAHKRLIAKFTVPYNAKRSEIEKEIEEKLRSGTVVWEDDDYGVNVGCIHKDNMWRPRKRFLVPDEGKR